MANQDFNTTLELYRNNLTEYKLTGNSAFKTAADSAQAWLESYVKSLEQQAKDQSISINKFVAQYEKSNPELAELQTRIKKVQEEGPKLQDVYETEKEAQEEEPVDFTPYYVKVGLIIGVLAVTAFL